jgi:hypothetical protein
VGSQTQGIFGAKLVFSREEHIDVVRTGGYVVVYCLKTFVARAGRTVPLSGVEMSFVQPVA